MYVVDSRYGGVRASVYWMNPGDKIPRHAHDVEHTCHCLSGSVEVEQYDEPGNIEMLYWKGKKSSMMLPAQIDHEIRALLPNTVVMQMMDGKGVLIPYVEPKK